MRRLHSAGMSLDAAASMTRSPGEAGRIAAAVQELDVAARLIRESVYGHSPAVSHELRLRQEIVRPCSGVTPGRQLLPEFSFRGPVDDALADQDSRRLPDVLREALTAIGKTSRPAEVGVWTGL